MSEGMQGRSLLMGNEAIALGAMRAGVRLVAGYPGTPSTEILETVAKRNDGSVYVEWSTNEKAALEVAAGAAYAGARSMVTMKQVGLNVASDPLMSLAYVGVKGGMVVVVADDPGPISSQTEQDTRHFAAFAKLPVFDRSSGLPRRSPSASWCAWGAGRPAYPGSARPCRPRPRAARRWRSDCPGLPPPPRSFRIPRPGAGPVAYPG